MSINLEAGKWYVTKCGYLVHIEKINPDVCYASVDTSAGLNSDNLTAIQAFKGKRGWAYNSNGSTNSLKDNDGMTIVAEYPGKTELPDGYEWKDGFPKLYMFSELSKDDYFIGYDGQPWPKNLDIGFASVATTFGAKRIGLVKKTEAPPKTETKLKLEIGKWYVTAGDYLVFLKEAPEHWDGLSLSASLETSPGTNTSGITAAEIAQANKHQHGWKYIQNDHGKIVGLSPEWCEKLRIVAEYQYPVKLPDVYAWKGGFPKLYAAEDIFNDWCILTNGNIVENNSRSPFNDATTIGIKRIGLVRKNVTPVPIKETGITQPKLQLATGKWYITKGDYLVNIVHEDKTNKFFNASVETSPGCTLFGTTVRQIAPINKGWAYCADNKIKCLKPEWTENLEIVAEYPYPVKLPDGYTWKGGFPKLYESNELSAEDYFMSCAGNVYGSDVIFYCGAKVIGAKRIGLVKVDKPVESSISVPVPIVESEEEMKKETAIKIATVAGNLGFRALNYWFFEPAVNTFRPVVKGVRYAVFIGTLASAVYGYKHPDVVKNAIMSCLPKVSVEAPEILK